jgi:hypothetical protein
MRSLQALVGVVSQQPSQQLQQWLSSSVNSKSVQLYLGILNRQFQSDIDASLVLYGKTGESNYRRAKFQLKAQLIKMLRYMPMSKEEEQDETIKRAHYQFISTLLLARQVDKEVIEELSNF